MIYFLCSLFTCIPVAVIIFSSHLGSSHPFPPRDRFDSQEVVSLHFCPSRVELFKAKLHLKCSTNCQSSSKTFGETWGMDFSLELMGVETEEVNY